MTQNDPQCSALATFFIQLLLLAIDTTTRLLFLAIDTTTRLLLLAIDAIISMDSFLWPLWTSLALSVDETLHNAHAFFSCSSNKKTTSTGPASQLSTTVNKTLQWIEPFLLPTPKALKEEPDITAESIEFLEDGLNYLTRFFDTAATTFATTSPRSLERKNPSAVTSSITSSIPVVCHTPVRSQVDPVAKTCAPGRYSVVFYEHSSGNAGHTKKISMVWHMPHTMDNMIGEASGVAQAVQVAGEKLRAAHLTSNETKADKVDFAMSELPLWRFWL